VAFFVEETPVVKQDQVVTGHIKVAKNAANPRCIDVALTYETTGMNKAASHTYTISDTPNSEAQKRSAALQPKED